MAEERKNAQFIAEGKLQEQLAHLKEERKRTKKEFSEAIHAVRTKDVLETAIGSKVAKSRRRYTEKERYVFVEAVLAYQILQECTQKEALKGACDTFKGIYEGLLLLWTFKCMRIINIFCIRFK